MTREKKRSSSATHMQRDYVAMADDTASVALQPEQAASFSALKAALASQSSASSLPALADELAVFERLLKRNQSQHRHTKYFQHLDQVRRGFKRRAAGAPDEWPLQRVLDVLSAESAALERAAADWSSLRQRGG